MCISHFSSQDSESFWALQEASSDLPYAEKLRTQWGHYEMLTNAHVQSLSRKLEYSPCNDDRLDDVTWNWLLLIDNMLVAQSIRPDNVDHYRSGGIVG